MPDEIKTPEHPVDTDIRHTIQPDPFLVALLKEVERELQVEEVSKPQAENPPPVETHRSPSRTPRERPIFNFD